jgi:CheY-like chemotaxis protein/HPt (histidine-containing phosphotransfer) domain-containing protein
LAVAKAALAVSREDGLLIAEDSMKKMLRAAGAVFGANLSDHAIAINGIDSKQGMENSGGVLNYYIDVLKTYCEDGQTYFDKINASLAANNIELFTTHIHALKSASANIGAQIMSEHAKMLEEAGNKKDIKTIQSNIGSFLADFSALLDAIKIALEKMPADATQGDGDQTELMRDDAKKLKAAREKTMQDEMKTIFLVDDNTTNLVVGKNTLKGAYKTFTMPSAEKMFEMLAKIKPDLILLDVEMPKKSDYEAIRELKAGPYAAIPVAFISANDNLEAEEKSRNLGAIDYIHKPFSPQDLLSRVAKILCN